MLINNTLNDLTVYKQMNPGSFGKNVPNKLFRSQVIYIQIKHV